jgi:hypothetical protein
MNFINRITSFSLFLIAFLVFIVLAVAPFEALAWIQTQIGHLSQWLHHYQISNTLFFNLGRVALAAIAILILIPLMIAELPRKKSEPAVTMRTEHGEIRVTAESIAKRLAWHLDQLADVITVVPVVQPKGDTVHVKLNVETSPAIDLPMKPEEIMLVTKEIIEQDMGLKLGKLNVNLRHAAYPVEM